MSKIANLIDGAANQASKLRTINWAEIIKRNVQC